jgi:GTP cyclohydrolase I
MSFQTYRLLGEDAVRQMLKLIGEDPTREGLVETPSRVFRAWGEWFSGYSINPADLLAKDFEDGAEDADGIVLLTNIPVQSHCEHHITPIIGVAHVAYIPNGRVVGISKIARLVDAFSRRLQIQERLTNQIANVMDEVLDPLAVGVIITAQHFCMTTRGCKTPGVDTTTSALRGAFKDEADARAEFLQLIQQATARSR